MLASQPDAPHSSDTAVHSTNRAPPPGVVPGSLVASISLPPQVWPEATPEIVGGIGSFRMKQPISNIPHCRSFGYRPVYPLNQPALMGRILAKIMPTRPQRQLHFTLLRLRRLLIGGEFSGCHGNPPSYHDGVASTKKETRSGDRTHSWLPSTATT